MEDKFDQILTKIDKLAKEISRKRLQNKQEIETEAKELLKIHLEKALADFNEAYDAPGNEPRELDKDDSRDRKVICYMTKMINTSINALCDCDGTESTHSSDSDETEDGESSDDEPVRKSRKQEESGSLFG